MKTQSLTCAVVMLAALLAEAHDWNGKDGGFGIPPAPSPVSAAGNMAQTFSYDGITGAVRRCVEAFSAFRPHVRFFWDTNYFRVESDGVPNHSMMTGISAWQQQIPVPTYYFATNAWRLPLNPAPVDVPYLITSGTFTRGAVALAANGVPVFNPFNNRGEVSALIGELDQWGGHCGRSDDYHYHVAPLHLTNILGSAIPIAFALDGYPIYGLVEPDGSPVVSLDTLNGHTNGPGFYHYHSSTTLPYVQAGFHGFVTYTNNQVDPQPVAATLRPAGTPLNGAVIVDFTNRAEDLYSLIYTLTGDTNRYEWLYQLRRTNRTVTITWNGPGGTTTSNYPNWNPAPTPVTNGVTQLVLSNDLFQLTITGQLSRGYALEVADELTAWSLLEAVQTGTNGLLTVPLSSGSGRTFFRLR